MKSDHLIKTVREYFASVIWLWWRLNILCPLARWEMSLLHVLFLTPCTSYAPQSTAITWQRRWTDRTDVFAFWSIFSLAHVQGVDQVLRKMSVVQASWSHHSKALRSRCPTTSCPVNWKLITGLTIASFSEMSSNTTTVWHAHRWSFFVYSEHSSRIQH